jgi:hypothetical protein
MDHAHESKTYYSNPHAHGDFLVSQALNAIKRLDRDDDFDWFCRLLGRLQGRFSTSQTVCPDAHFQKFIESGSLWRRRWVPTPGADQEARAATDFLKNAGRFPCDRRINRKEP